MSRILSLAIAAMVCTFVSPGQDPFLRETIYSPVLVTTCQNYGSGFYWKRDTTLYFVTAAHVLFKDTSHTALLCHTITLESHSKPSRKADNTQVIDLQAALAARRIVRHRTQDIAVLLVGFISQASRASFQPYVTTVEHSDSGIVAVPSYLPFEEVCISNDVYLLGYPRAIGFQNSPQLDYSQPLLRKGAVAGKNMKNRTIIIDCPSYPGNSGGPVFEIDYVPWGGHTYRLIGVLVESIPFPETWVNTVFRYTNISISNSGYSVVVPIDYAADLVSAMSHQQTR